MVDKAIHQILKRFSEGMTFEEFLQFPKTTKKEKQKLLHNDHLIYFPLLHFETVPSERPFAPHVHNSLQNVFVSSPT